MKLHIGCRVADEQIRDLSCAIDQSRLIETNIEACRYEPLGDLQYRACFIEPGRIGEALAKALVSARSLGPVIGLSGCRDR